MSAARAEFSHAVIKGTVMCLRIFIPGFVVSRLVVQMLLALIGLGTSIHWLHFYRPWANVWHLTTYLFCLLASILAAVLFAESCTLHWPAFVGAVAALTVISAFVGALLHWLRISSIRSRSRRGKILSPVAADILARHTYPKLKEPLTSSNRSKEVFELALEHHPTSAYLLVRYAAYLLLLKRNASLSLAMLRRTLDEPTFVDTSFIRYCLNRIRMEAQLARGEQSAELERALAAIRRQEIKVRVHSLSFWSALLTADTKTLKALPGFMAKIEHAKSKTTSLYRDLMEDAPNMPKVLDAYAQFQCEILEDVDGACKTALLAEKYASISTSAGLLRPASEMLSRSQPFVSADDAGAGVNVEADHLDDRPPKPPYDMKVVVQRQGPHPRRASLTPIRKLTFQRVSGELPAPASSSTLHSKSSRTTDPSLTTVSTDTTTSPTSGLGSGSNSSRPATKQIESDREQNPDSHRDDDHEPGSDAGAADSDSEAGSDSKTKPSNLCSSAMVMRSLMSVTERAHRRVFILRLYRRNTCSVLLMHLALALCLCIGIAALIIVFEVANHDLQLYQDRLTLISTQSYLRRSLIDAAWDLRSLQISLIPAGSTSTASSAATNTTLTGTDDTGSQVLFSDISDLVQNVNLSPRTGLLDAMSFLDQSVSSFYYGSLFPQLRSLWLEPITVTELLSLSPGSPALYNRTVDLFDAIVEISTAGKAVSRYPNLTLAHGLQDPLFFYVMYNSHRDMVERADYLYGRYTSYLLDAINQFGTTSMVIFGVMVAALIVLQLAIFTPTICAVKKRRKRLLSLFLEIPKSAVQNICEDVRTSLKTATSSPSEASADDDVVAEMASVHQVSLEASLSRKRWSFSTQLVIRLVIWTVLVIIPTFAICFTCYRFTRNAADKADIIISSFGLGYLVRKAGFLAQELLVADPIVWPGGLAEIYATMRATASQVNSDFAVFKMYDDPSSVAGQVPIFVRRFVSLLQSIDRLLQQVSLGAVRNTILLSQNAITLLDTRVSLFVQNMTSDIEKVQGVIGIIFGISLPALLIAYFFLGVLGVSKARKDLDGDISMILMIPFKTIQQTPAIRNFFKLGDEPALDISAILARSQEETRNILEAAMDAIVVTSETGTIQMANKACGEMFGHKQEYLNNESIQLFVPSLPPTLGSLPSGQIKSQSHTGRRTDGFEFPVVVSIGKGNISGQTSFLVFTIRDVTERENIEKALLAEKARSDELLTHVLPADIAKRLKSGESPIADLLDDVTLMFADLVGFTAMSSTMSPRETVDLLSSFFAVFERSSEKYGVEKLKTIGDAVFYFTTGRPEKMIDFSLETLAGLQLLNEQWHRVLQARVGINTGSVVAAVVSGRKLAWDMWGDAVNLASRMESTGVPGRVQVTQHTYERVKYKFLWEPRTVEVKGKGSLPAYLVIKRTQALVT